MMVHVLSGQWPFPGEAVRVNPRNPNNPNDVVGVTEFDRREEYINLIGNEHPLMTLIQGCLSNSPSHRPTSSEVHQRVSAVAADHPPSFTNRVEMMERINTLSQENERVRAEKDTAVAEKDVITREKEIISSELQEAQSTIGSLRESHSIEVEALQIENTDIKADIEHLHAIIMAKENEYKSDKERHKSDKEEIKQRYENQLETMKKEKHAMEEQRLSDRQSLEEKHLTVKHSMEQQHAVQLESKVSELSAKDALISSKSSTIQSLQVKLGQALGTASSKDNLSVFSPGVKLTFIEHASVPEAIGFLGQGITVGGDVYIGVDHDKKVFKYSITEDSWDNLPLAPIHHARIGCLNKKILTVGGRISSNQVTADIHEFDETSQQWVKSTSIPPMPTGRAGATAVSWSSPPALIVCGGQDNHKEPMTIVEVYHGRTSQWHAVTPLPFPRDYMTHTVIHNVLYLVGGYEGKKVTSCKKTVLSTLIPQLLETSLQSSLAQWQSLSITDVYNYKPTAASLGGCLLAVGGKKELTYPTNPKSVVSSVHAYCPSTSSWVLVGQLPQPLYNCATATLPTRELLVIGGRNSSGITTNTTYKCSLSMPSQ